jgi:hypothetical protein
MYGIPPFPPQYQRPEQESQSDKIMFSRDMIEVQDFVPMSVFDFMLSMLEHEKPAIVAAYLNAFTTIVMQPGNIIKLVNRGFVECLLSLYKSEHVIIKKAALQTLVAIAKYHQFYHTIIGKLQHVDCVKVNENEFGEPKIKYGIVSMHNIKMYLESDLFNTKECLYVEAHMALMHFLICCGVEITSVSGSVDIFSTFHPTILDYVEKKRVTIPLDHISYDMMKLIQQKIFRERMTKIVLFMTASKDNTKQLLSSDFIKYELAPFLG